MSEKLVSFRYPIANSAAALKEFQDITSQIRGFYFTKSHIKDVEKIPFTDRNAIYFLFNLTDGDENNFQSVYIGQSENGISRVKNHVVNKDFWQFCLMFVTDNNKFDKTCIDYLEYDFIQKFRKSEFHLINKQLREKMPTVDTTFQKPILDSYIEQIVFLLSANGIEISEERKVVHAREKLYQAQGAIEAKLYIHDGKFILKAGSIIKKPAEKSKNRNDNGAHYRRFSAKFQDFIDNNQAEQLNEFEAKTTVDITFSSPSTAAVMCSGTNQNGWLFWKGLEEERFKENE